MMRRAMLNVRCIAVRSSGRIPRCWQGQVADLVKEVTPPSSKSRTMRYPATTCGDHYESGAIRSRIEFLCRIQGLNHLMPRCRHHSEFATIRSRRNCCMVVPQGKDQLPSAISTQLLCLDLGD